MYKVSFSHEVAVRIKASPTTIAGAFTFDITWVATDVLDTSTPVQKGGECMTLTMTIKARMCHSQLNFCEFLVTLGSEKST